MSVPNPTASLYKRNGQVVLCANAMTRDGFPVDAEPFVLLTEPVDAADLGRTTVEALKQFRASGTADQSNTEFLSYFAMMAGVANVRDVLTDAQFCTVELITDADGSDTIQISPMVNDEGAFDDAADAPVLVDATGGHEAIGRAAAQALARAR